MTRIVVVGAGIVGAAIARRLADRGLAVTVVEASRPAGGTSLATFSWVNALGKQPEAYFELNLSPLGLDRLSHYLWAAFEKSGDGSLRRLAAGPEPGSVFYAATGTYSASYTCNTWTAEGLRVGGIAVTPAGVVFVSDLTDQLRSLSGRAAEVR